MKRHFTSGDPLRRPGTHPAALSHRQGGPGKVSLCILCLAFAGSTAAQPTLLVTTPKVIRDADGIPVLVYGDNDPSGPLLVTQERFLATPVLVARQPPVRDISGNAV